jgi:hypothetical protein
LTQAGGPYTTRFSKQVSSGGANAELEHSPPDPGRLGRAAGIAVFWLLLSYVIGMSALSIIPSLFWPQIGPRAHAARLEQCALEIATLNRELVDQAAESLRGHGPANLGHFLRDWDQHYMALSGGCGPLEGARADLLKLRADVESLLRSYQGGAMKAQERIRRALELVKRPASTARSKG